MSKVTFNTDNPKTKQFEEELNVLLDKYQYELRTELIYTTTSIKPTLQLVDSVPPKDAPKTTLEKAREEANKKKKGKKK